MKISLCGYRQNGKVSVSKIGNLALSGLSFVSEIQIDRCSTVILAELVHLKESTTWLESKPVTDCIRRAVWGML